MHHPTKALWQDKQYEHVGAYYTLGYDAKNLFQGLKMEACDTFAKHLNKHHVIYIDFNRLPDVCRHYKIISVSFKMV